MASNAPSNGRPALPAARGPEVEARDWLDSFTAPAADPVLRKRLAERRKTLSAEAGWTAELAVAREIQTRLFPQRMPPLRTLDYAGNCDEAQAIGGDYYDYLDMGRGRVGLVLADVSGKGICAALLMASLQASLRSRQASSREDLAAMFRSVNKLFCESVTLGFFATLFFAEYSDATRVLRYVNCGHHPAFLVRADGSFERLNSTATVLGLFPEWDCAVRRTRMSPGDILVMYSDGVTEARSTAGELFGEERLLRLILANASRPAEEILRAIAASARGFGEQAHEDDLSLLVARAR